MMADKNCLSYPLDVNDELLESKNPQELQIMLDHCDDYATRRKIRSLLRRLGSHRPSLPVINGPLLLLPHRHVPHHNQHPRHSLIPEVNSNEASAAPCECHAKDVHNTVNVFEEMLNQTEDLEKRRELRKILRDMKKQSTESATLLHTGCSKTSPHSTCRAESIVQEEEGEEEEEPNDSRLIVTHMNTSQGDKTRHVYQVSKVEHSDADKDIVSHCTTVHTKGEDYEQTDTTITRDTILRTGTVLTHSGSVVIRKIKDKDSGKTKIERDVALNIHERSPLYNGIVDKGSFVGGTAFDFSDKMPKILHKDNCDHHSNAADPCPLVWEKKLSKKMILKSGQSLRLECQLKKNDKINTMLMNSNNGVWKKGSEILNDGSQGFVTFREDELFTLMKNQVDASDAGRYSFELEHDHGKLSTVGDVEVFTVQENHFHENGTIPHPTDCNEAQEYGMANITSSTTPKSILSTSNFLPQTAPQLDSFKIIMTDQEALAADLSKLTTEEENKVVTEEKKEAVEEKKAVEPLKTATKPAGTIPKVGANKSKPAPSAAKSAMSAFKAMDKQANPEGPAKPNFTTAPKAGSASGNARNPAAVKQLLLDWCKQKTVGYEGVNVQNFSGSWSDGLAFCALTHHFFPDAFDFSSLKKENRRENFTLAFDTAEKLGNVAQLLDVNDMVMMKNPDWKCVFCYIQTYYQQMRSRD